MTIAGPRALRVARRDAAVSTAPRQHDFARRRHHGQLPVAPDRLLGREHQVAAVCARLSETHVRLLTLVGPPGIGKTRLALAVAHALLPRFADGVLFVELASIRELALLVPALLGALGMNGASHRPALDRLQHALRDREILLVLDNFEHLLEAAPIVAELLATCPDVTALVTSRAALRLRGEHEYPVPPLDVPGLARAVDARSVERSSATALFLERARAARPDFQVSDGNARAVAEVCARLDGLPLAIELAAVRTKLLAPAAILARLGDETGRAALQLLTGGARDFPPRHQTLRQAIAWSHDLLDPPDQRLFRRLAAFVGGCTLEAAEAICADLDDGPTTQRLDVLEGLTSLVDKSLLRHELRPGGGSRFSMLETIGEYALEQLESSGEAEAIRHRHGQFFLALAEQAQMKLISAEQGVWQQRLADEHDNLRAVLRWAAERGQSDVELRLVGALHWFWYMRSYASEGRRWLENALARGASAAAAPRARTLIALAWLEFRQWHPERVLRPIEQAVALGRELGDKHIMALALATHGLMLAFAGDPDRGEPLCEEGLALAREVGEPFALGLVLNNLARLLLHRGDRARGDLQRAAVIVEEGLRHVVATGNTIGVGHFLEMSGLVRCAEGDPTSAETLFQQSLDLFSGIGDVSDAGVALRSLGQAAYQRGDLARAEARCAESLATWWELGHAWGIPQSIELLARVAMGQAALERAVRLFGAAAAFRHGIDTPMAPADVDAYERHLGSARETLGEQAFAEAWADGWNMPSESVMQYALAATESASDPRDDTPRTPLTRREREVAILIAGGLTNRQVATELVIALRTAEAHVEHILDKLGLTTRTQVATWVIEQGWLAKPMA